MQQGLTATASAGGTCCSPTRTFEWGPGALRALVTAAEGDDRALVSQLALLRTQTGWERIVVPACVLLRAALPVQAGQRPRSRTAAGGRRLHAHPPLGPGQGRRADADQRRAHRRRGAGTLLKRDGNRSWLGLSTEIRSVRPYPGWRTCGR